MRFVLIDDILALELARSITTRRKIGADEDYFPDHFPGVAAATLVFGFIDRHLVATGFEDEVLTAFRDNRRAAS